MLLMNMQGNNNFNNNGTQSNFKTTYNLVYENEDEELLFIDYRGAYNLIGFSKSYVDKLEAICLEHKQKREEYYNLLIEHNIIEKELTAEEKLNLLLEKIDKQDNRIKELESILKDKEEGEKNA